MKIVAVLGSPRKNGNSAAIAQRFCQTAQSLGADIETFTLRDLHYSGCVACMGCKTSSESCVLRDDLTPVLDAVAQADVLVLAAPIYFGELASQAKAFVDRTFSFLKPDFTSNPTPGRLAPGKKLVFIQTQGWDDSQFRDVFPRYKMAFEYEGIPDAYFILGAGLGGAGDAASQSWLMEMTDVTARQVMA